MPLHQKITEGIKNTSRKFIPVRRGNSLASILNNRSGPGDDQEFEQYDIGIIIFTAEQIQDRQALNHKPSFKMIDIKYKGIPAVVARCLQGMSGPEFMKEPQRDAAGGRLVSSFDSMK